MGVEEGEVMFPWDQLLDILDTAVKIGLGAVISAVVTLKVAKVNFDSDIRKTRWLRHCEMFETYSEKSERYIWATWQLLSAIEGTAIYNEKHKIAAMLPGQWEHISERDTAFLESRTEMNSVIGRLRLIGAKSAARELLRVSDAVAEFRDPIMLERHVPDLDSLKTEKEKIRNIIGGFRDALNIAYENLHPK